MRVLVAVLLRLFPRPFRERFAAAMIDSFEAAQADARARGTSPGALYMRTVADLLRQAMAEWIQPTVGAAAAGAGRNSGPDRQRPGGVVVFGASLLRDVRLAVRMLVRRPAFAVAAIVTLAIGIGATTAVFAVVDNLLIRPLPFPEPDRLVELWSWNRDTGDGRPGVAADLRRAWERDSGLFDTIEVFDSGDRVLVTSGEPEQVHVVAITPGFLDLLGRRPSRGRGFVAADSAADADPVVIVSDGLWRRRFGADPAVLGEVVRLDDTSFEVIGVMPRSFAFPDQTAAMWVVLPDDAAGYPLARLAAGLDIDAARQRAEVVAQRFQDEGRAEAGWGIELFNLRDSFIFSVGASSTKALWVLLAAGGLLLLIAAANIGNLVLSLAGSRDREFAVRAALGAGRNTVVQQLAVEGLLLGTVGGMLGLGVAFIAVRLAALWAPPRLNFLNTQPIAVDARVLAFAMAAALGATFLFAVLPALFVARQGPLSMTATGGDRRRGQRIRGVLVVAEVAIATVLLVGAGLLVRSMSALLDVDPGFDDGVTVVTLAPSPARYADPTAYRLMTAQIEALAATLPGVEAAAVTTGAPPLMSSLTSANRAEAEGQPPADGVYRGGNVQGPSQVEFVNVVNVSNDYFRVLGVPVLSGRGFAPGDADEQVAIISEDFARRFWHGESPIGGRLRLREHLPWLTIVGVVGDVLQSGLDDEAGTLELYYPMAQTRAGRPRLSVLLQGDVQTASLLPALRTGLASIDDEIPINSVSTVGDALFADLAPQRFNMGLLLGFAAAALVLAAVGIYGVLAYHVVRRTREIGIRVAVGAGRADVVRTIVGTGMALAGGGLLLGAGASWALTRYMQSLLFGVEPLDLPTVMASAALLATIALLACLLPSLRATRVDPVIALRAE